MKTFKTLEENMIIWPTVKEIFITLATVCLIIGFASLLAKKDSQKESTPIYSDQTMVTFGSSEPEATYKIIAPARVVSVHDGDTVTVELRVQTNIRLIDCWAPEITGNQKPQGLKSKEFLQTLLVNGDNITVEVPFKENFSKSLTLSRILARIYKDVDGDGLNDDVSKLMVNGGFAKEKK